MTRDEVNALAQKAGMWVHPRKNEARFGLGGAIGDDCTPELQRFADLVIEMCAAIADNVCPCCHDESACSAAESIAEDIRARKDSA